MRKDLEKCIYRKSRTYWHYYHLKRDADFKREVAELIPKIIISTQDDPHYIPTDIEDYDYMEDPNKRSKLKLINDFQNRWNIHWDNILLNYLIRGDEDDLPIGNDYGIGISVGLNKDNNMFEVQVPVSVEREDFGVVWTIIEALKRDVGIAKKPRKNTFTERKSKIAFKMWKMLRDDKSWTEVTKAIDSEFGTSYTYHITDAKSFLKANGFSIR